MTKQARHGSVSRLTQIERRLGTGKGPWFEPEVSTGHVAFLWSVFDGTVHVTKSFPPCGDDSSPILYLRA